jgi:RHS repeat-associated protein
MDGVLYDVNGRMIQDPAGNKYTYDESDRLLQVENRESSLLNRYRYYPDEALQSSDNQGNPQRFYYDGSAANVTLNETSQEWASFLLSPQQRESVYTAGDVAYYHTSNRSTAALSSLHSGDATFSYTPYGATTVNGQVNASSSFSWNQEYQDRLTNLVYLRARFYAPGILRFISMDSSRQDNRYSFGNADPINMYDPTGHSAVASAGVALAVSAVVGIIATVLTGGAAAAIAAEVVGAEATAVGITAGIVGGAMGSLAGDGAKAGLRGEKFTAGRAFADLVSGAIAGGAGAVMGGAAGSAAMQVAMSRGFSQVAVTAVGGVSAGLAGGLTGSFAAAGVNSLIYQTPLFSSSNLVNFAIGAVAGIGGGLVSSGAALGFSGKMLPVPVHENEFNSIEVQRLRTQDASGSHRSLASFVKTDEHAADIAIADSSRALRLNPSGQDLYDTIDVHGYKNGFMVNTIYRGTETYRPIPQKNFAKYLAQNSDLYGGKNSAAPVKLLSCKGAFANAQVLANAIQRPVYAAYPSMSISDEVRWHPFFPK